MTSEMFDLNGLYLIVLLSDNNIDSMSEIKRILNDCWSRHITKVNVLLPTQNHDGIVLYTYYPFNAKFCEQVKPIVYNSYTNGSFVERKPHYPQKFSNLHRCPLRVSTFDLSPHMMLTDCGNGTFYTDGIEGITLRVLSQRMNFTPIVLVGGRNVLRWNDDGNNRPRNRSGVRPTLEMVRTVWTLLKPMLWTQHEFICGRSFHRTG